MGNSIELNPQNASSWADHSFDELMKIDHTTVEKATKAFIKLPESASPPAKSNNPTFDAELDTKSLDDTFYSVVGDTLNGGAIVCKLSESVEFADDLNKQIVNLVPLADTFDAANRVSEETQTVGIYPERLRAQLRDALTLNDAQRTPPLAASTIGESIDRQELRRMPDDGGEPLRRAVRCIVDQSAIGQ